MGSRWKLFCVFLFLGILFSVSVSQGQESAGLPFLKIGVGARQAGMGDVFTGVGDDVHTLYWNPGGLGHIRRWQWSATYNRWFADVYQANVSFVRQFRLLGSHKTSIGLIGNYVGMPSWDATGGKEPPVSAGHFVGGVSVGQRLDWISHALAIGVNVKAISSRFDTCSAFGMATDVGFLLKPDRFALGSLGLGIFEYGIFSVGASLCHLGSEMTFDAEASSLPQTWRTGVSLKVGRYGGWSLLLASDVMGVRDRDVVVGMGTEIWWRDVLGARLGYRLNGEDLGDFSFGLGMRWDNVMNSLLGLPTRFGDAFEVNVADVGYGDALQQTYRGTLTHYPVAPEPFLLEEPRVVVSQVMGESSLVYLNWEEANDPDPFDEVGYFIVIDGDEGRIERTIRSVERNMDGFLTSSLRDSLMVCESIPSTSYVTRVAEGGIYYWAVFAYDLAQHVQLAQRGEENVSEFIIATQDLVVKDFVFTPTPWITTTPEQGMLSFVVANEGIASASGTRFVVQDVFVGEQVKGNTARSVLLDVEIPLLGVKEDTAFQIPWATAHQGLHRIEATVYPDSMMLELERENNYLHEMVFSVPKGVLLAPDSVEVMATGFDSTEVPVVPEVYFETHSSHVDTFYYTERSALPSVLVTLAARLKEHPDVALRLMGSVDALTGEEDVTLADERAESVKRRLVDLGVPASQIVVVRDHPGKVLGRRRMPADSLDAKWIMEQNRVVALSVSQQADELKIFKPHRVAVDTTIRDGATFHIDVRSPAGIDEWSLMIEPRSVEMTEGGLVSEDRLSGDLFWDGTDQNDVPVPRNREYGYTLVLTDTLGRSFRTRMDSLYLEEKRTIRRREVFGAAKFAQSEPVYQFYWDRLMDVARELVENPTMRLRFEGHACVIGPEHVNDRLSYQRAQGFTRTFVERLQRAYPNTYRTILERIDPPVGFGEKEPLWVKLKNRGKVMLGDNDSPVGRYLNRRIMVLLYTEN